MNLVELFSGSGNVSSSFRSYGFETFEIDNRKRSGVCMPDLKLNILDLKRRMIPFDKIDVVWCGLPCTAYSHASGNHYRDADNNLNHLANSYIKLLKFSLNFIEENHPLLYFIENPTGRLRYQKLMIDFLARTSGMIKYCTLGSYGFDTTKPTDIFTNATQLQLRTPLKFGRGYKAPGIFSNLSLIQRQQTPQDLCNDIAKQSTLMINNISLHPNEIL